MTTMLWAGRKQRIRMVLLITRNVIPKVGNNTWKRRISRRNPGSPPLWARLRKWWRKIPPNIEKWIHGSHKASKFCEIYENLYCYYYSAIWIIKPSIQKKTIKLKYFMIKMVEYVILVRFKHTKYVSSRWIFVKNTYVHR